MKTVFTFFCLGLLFTVSGQNYTPLSQAERDLIGNASDTSMRVLQLTAHEDSLILKSVSHDIDPEDPSTRTLAQRMLLSVIKTGGVGIAAPQVGINRRLILVQRFDKVGFPFEVFINPRILWASGLYQSGPEGDLSFEERADVKRNYIVQIEYENPDGETISEILEGFTAVIYQHERDHLDGILLTDRAQSFSEENFHEVNSGLYRLTAE